MQKGIGGLFIILSLLVIGGAIVAVSFYLNKVNLGKIADFDSCAKAGNPVLKSYPEQCNTKEGGYFVQEVSDEEKKKLIPPTPEPSIFQIMPDWEVFGNGTYQIEYPPEWIYRSLSGTPGGGAAILSKDASDHLDGRGESIKDTGYSYLYLRTFENSSTYTSKEDLIKSLSQDPKVVSSETLKINGEEALKQIIQNKDGKYETLILLDNMKLKKTYLLDIVNEEGKYPSKDQDIFDQIITTFQLLK